MKNTEAVTDIMLGLKAEQRVVKHVRESCDAFGYSAFDTNVAPRSYSISHNPAFPSQLCPAGVIHLQDKKNKTEG